jgi:hypothetical protein
MFSVWTWEDETAKVPMHSVRNGSDLCEKLATESVVAIRREFTSNRTMLISDCDLQEECPGLGMPMEMKDSFQRFLKILTQELIELEARGTDQPRDIKKIIEKTCNPH